MKTILWGLFALVFSTSLRAQIYPDEIPDIIATVMPPGEYVEPFLRLGRERPNVNFPTVTEMHDIDGDGVPEPWQVETLVVNTLWNAWIGPKSGKAVINALSLWIYSNNIKLDSQGNLRNKLIIRMEPYLTYPKRDSGGDLQGVKVSFIRLDHNNHPRLRPMLCFLPYLDSQGNMAHVVLPKKEVEMLENKMLSDYQAQAKHMAVVVKSGKKHTRRDGLVSFGGIWIGTTRSIPVPSPEMELSASATLHGALSSRVIMDDDPEERPEEKPQDKGVKP